MTPTKLVEIEIDRFVRSKSAEVLCISGDWGVGKTYTWQLILDRAKNARMLGLNEYSYVSLFGVSSLEDLKLVIFENSKNFLPRTEDAGLSSMVAEGRSKLWDLYKKNFRRTSDLPYVGSLGKLTSAISFSLIENVMICIDDLERRGAGLSVKDVLGLASYLKEQRKCKVVLLLNFEALDKVSKDELEVHREKVVDVSVTFAPTPEDSVRIALPSDDRIERILSENCRLLGISNIRVIKKIERHVRIVEALIGNLNEGVLRRAIRTLTLFGWSKYQPNIAPPLEYLKTRRGMSSMVRAAERTPDDQKWGAFLDAKGISTLDEFDGVVLKGIEVGFFDPEAIQASASKFEKQLEIQVQDGSFEQAWRSYHDSFDDNEAEVVGEICGSFQKNVQSISPMNLNGTVVLLRELGHNEKAEELIRYYLAHRGDPWKFWDLEESAFGDQVTDAAVIGAFKDRYQAMLPEANATDALLKLAKGQSLEDYETAALIRLSADDYVSIFKSNRGEDFSRLIYGALYYQRVANANQEMRDMTARVRTALKRIGSESPINRRRVRKYGIVLEDEISAPT